MTLEVESIDPVATIEAWRASGLHLHDPVRFRSIEALARRAAVQQGAARRIIDARLMQWVAAYGESLDGTRGIGESIVEPAALDETANRHGLAQLIDQLGRDRLVNDDDSLTAETLQYLRSTWLRLSTDRRMTQAQATVPDNPGPLNSHHLVHQALQSMRTLSPGYLDHFMSYVDALLWLDGVNTDAGMPITSSQREAPPKRAARKKTS